MFWGLGFRVFWVWGSTVLWVGDITPKMENRDVVWGFKGVPATPMTYSFHGLFPPMGALG